MYSPPVPEDGTPSRLITFALKTGAVAASVNNIPHQPTYFTVSCIYLHMYVIVIY